MLLIPLALGCGQVSQQPRAEVAGRAAPTQAPGRDVLPPLTVLQRLRGAEAERRACFVEAEHVQDGFVKLAWEVNQDGKVGEVAVEATSVHEPDIEACLAKAVAKLDFGPRQTLAEARWTFVHRLPKLPGVDTERAKNEQRKKKQQKNARQGEEVAGVSIEDASPGRLELGRIEDIVHAGFPLFAYCYRAGLERNPSLGGLVKLRFVIDDEGSVRGVMDSGSEFADRSVLDCMAEGIFALDFPTPVGGDVRVQYRLVFESG